MKPAVANPISGQPITFSYRVDSPGMVTARIWDPDFDLIRELPATKTLPAGQHQLVWDGRDMNGRIVPNEAYFFTLEAHAPNGEVQSYDPITFSGGESGDVSVGKIDRNTGTLQYQLSRFSRVLVRAGMPGAAMLKTIVDWEPRAAGLITERWNGKDEDDLINLLADPRLRIVVTYFTLPEASVITVGNDEISYADYKRTLSQPRPKKPERPMANTRRISPHFLMQRSLDREIDVTLSFPKHDGSGKADVPEVRDTILVRVDVAKTDRPILDAGLFEVVFFQDFQFVGEEERGYVPYNYPWEVGQLPPGEHILTVNVVTFRNQIGVASRKIRVVR